MTQLADSERAPTFRGRAVLLEARRGSVGYLFLLPGLALYLLFVGWPIVGTFLLSLTSWNGATAKRPFVGLDNYSRMLHDPLVWTTLKHNLIWVALGTFVPIAVGLVLAILVSGAPRLRTLLRTGYFL